MAGISPQQIAQYAYNAGFRGNSLTMAIAIALAESGGNTTATNHNSNGSTDYGLWQINSSHTQYNATLLLANPQYNANAAWALSSQGSNWRPWCTAYSDAACGSIGGTFLGSGSPYQKYIAVAQQVVNGGVGSISIATVAGQATQAKPAIPQWCQPFMQHPIAWWEQNSNHFPTSSEGSAEGGVDWTPQPNNLPITALLPGVVVGAGYFCKPGQFCNATWQQCGGIQGYGVVTILSNNPYPNLVPGAQIQIYYQHIKIDGSIHTPRCDGSFGESVAAGQVIGSANGSYNVEVGVNIGSEWGGIWGPKSPGPHVDPIPFLWTLIAAGVPTGGVATSLGGGVLPNLTYSKLTSQVHQTLINTPGFYGIALAVDEAEQFPGFVDLTTPTTISVPGVSTPDLPVIGSQTIVPGATLSVPDFIGIARSIGATISDNFMPFAIRSGLILIGMVLLLLLIIKAVEPVARDLLPIVLE